MLVGFIHRVMNTDNMTISGEAIDYGPCAFMDTFDPATVFISIDHEDAMDRVNPVYIPHNHQVEGALAAASDGDPGPFRRLLDVLADPFDERPGLEPYATPAPPSFGRYRTFCGT